MQQKKPPKKKKKKKIPTPPYPTGFDPWIPSDLKMLEKVGT
jgi:hypothetical protein